jgi:tetratricopeptide (TPR) repeat protein
MVAIAPQGNRWLFGPVPDILIGCGVAYMAFFTALVFAGPQLRSVLPLGLLPLVSVFFGTPHYGATLLRVYEHRSERRAYAFFTVWMSLVVAALFVGGLYSLVLGSFLLSLYLTWSPWHYTGQNYGVALLFLRRRGVEITPQTKRFIYASFVLSYFLTFLAIHGAAYSGDYAPIEYGGSIYRFVRFGIPTPWWAYAFGIFGVAYVVCIAFAARDLLRRAPIADLVPTALVMATQMLWFSLPPLGRELGLLSSVDPFRPDNASFLFIWVAAGHAAQYLWITAYYAGERSPAARVSYYTKCVFAGSAIWSLPAILYVSTGLAGSRIGGLASGEDAGVLVAAMVNIHHFMIDGAIWKLRDGRVARALIRREAPDLSGSIGAPQRRWLAPVLLGAGALWTFSTIASLLERDRVLAPALAHGDVATAEESLGRLAWIKRDAPADYNRVAQVAAQRDNVDAVLRVLDRGIERHHHPATWKSKGAYLERIGRRDEALAALEAGLGTHPDDPDLLYAAGRLQLLQGKVETALATLEHAKAVAPDDKRIELTLERAREKRAAETPTPSGA